MKKATAKILYEQIKYYEKFLYLYEKFGYNVYYYYLKFREFITGRRIPMNFVYITNTQCTLRCKECHTYIPYFNAQSHFMVDFDTFKKELDKLLKCLDIIVSFRFQGGETLLTKDLHKMVKYACSKKQIQHIQIISNGTIIPSQELIDAMKNPKVILSLSDYSCIENIKEKLKYEEILKLCSDNGVNAKHWLTKKGDMWVGRNLINNNNICDKELSVKNFNQCFCFNNPKVFLFAKGKLHICPPSVYLYLNKKDFKFPEDEIIDVINTKEKILTKQIYALMSKKYFCLCSRCNAFENKDVRHIPGEQL